MKYFTPELYLRFKSPNRRVVEKAHDEWEEAIKGYEKHLAKIAKRLTPSTRELAGSLCLHDADYVGLGLPQPLQRDGSVAYLLLRKQTTEVWLVYLLAQEPLIEEVKNDWPFSKERVHWLYDEFDFDAEGRQTHEVLLSNGRIIRLTFYELTHIEHSLAERALA